MRKNDETKEYSWMIIKNPKTWFERFWNWLTVDRFEIEDWEEEDYE